MRTTPQRDGDRPAPTQSATTASDANLKRRRFLLALGAGSAASAAAATQAIASPVAATPAAEPAQGSGYRETQHVRDYYASTRI
jgi:hypothetical protein